MTTIGERVRQRIGEIRPSPPHREVADRVDMTPDAFSRALSGKRSFSSIELARIADLLEADLHWLITGRVDPHRVAAAARHDFDPVTGRREVPSRDADQYVLDDIALAYRQAYPEPCRSPQLPGSAGEVRRALGDDFVAHFVDRLEDVLAVDVVQCAELSTAYSFTIGGHAVIAVPAHGNWFRSNWSVAHELGHLVPGHHEQQRSAPEWAEHEAAANLFAADLLLPRAALAAIDWDGVDAADLADLVWRWGVSTPALANRIKALNGFLPASIAEWAQAPTQRLLRQHWRCRSGEDEITRRMTKSASRRFPLALREAHLEAIAGGRLGKSTLAWMLGLVDADVLEVDTPSGEALDVDDLSALGL